MSTENVKVMSSGVLALAQAIQERDEEINKLKEQLSNMQQINVVQVETPQKKTHRKRIVSADDNIFNPFKSNGVIKAQAAESIRSYDDFRDIQAYFLLRGKIRDWCLWTVGVACGLRISDLLSLQFKNVLSPTNSFYDRFLMYEKKTGKLNNVLITEAVIFAFSKYFNSMGWTFDRDDFIFSSNKGKGKEPMAPEYAWRIISRASRELELPIHVGSHTMRKSFANIVACVDDTTVDMNTIMKVQGLLNHSDQKTTMRYLGSFQNMYDNARRAVSDFVLGKSSVKEIYLGQQHTAFDELFNKLEEIENKICGDNNDD